MIHSRPARVLAHGTKSIKFFSCTSFDVCLSAVGREPCRLQTSGRRLHAYRNDDMYPELAGYSLRHTGAGHTQNPFAVRETPFENRARERRRAVATRAP